jgi:hypothetical protein
MATTHRDAVQDFLAVLDDDRREGFLEFAEHTYSVYEIWLYAGILGYNGGFTALEKWVQQRFKKLDRKRLILEEICSLQNDINFLREQVKMDLVKASDAAARIAPLSKELRGHIVEAEKMTRATDRRGLILAGADRVIRELKTIFRGNDEMTAALGLACESVWAALEEDR